MMLNIESTYELAYEAIDAEDRRRQDLYVVGGRHLIIASIMASNIADGF